MKLKYVSPEADLEELAAPFLDIRKRVVQYPTGNANQVRLIAISTTSGTGSEVTPFAVLIDKERGRKVTLADYSLSPDVAIVDPQFVMSMPRKTYRRHRNRLPDSRAGSGGFHSRFALHRLQCDAGHSHGVQVPAGGFRAPRG